MRLVHAVVSKLYVTVAIAYIVRNCLLHRMYIQVRRLHRK